MLIDLSPSELQVLDALITFHGDVFVRDCIGHVEALGMAVPEHEEGRQNFREFNRKTLDHILAKIREQYSNR